MRTTVLKILFSTLIIGLNFIGFSNTPDEKNLLKDARSYYMNGHFDLAKKNYEQLITLQPENRDYQFETGLAYYHSEINREKSLIYFEKAIGIDSKEPLPEAYYYCGLASLYSENLIKAKSYFSKFIPFIDPKEGKELLKDVHRLIEMCDNAEINFKTKNEKLQAFNHDDDLNSIYSEYAPILMKDETTLLFTARKRGSTGGKKSADAIYYEDIYIALKRDNKWLNSIKIDSLEKYTKAPINTGRHNAAISFNADETKLYLYKDADLYESNLVENKWSEPKKMNDNLNSREHEPSVFVSPDENYILFVSTRDGGNGGRDIYISEKNQNGEWGIAKNLSYTINTPFDDDAPFLTSDGKELYFSSKGHNSMGGFDIFKSVKDEKGNWGTPINMGIPFNSTADDIYFIKSSDHKNIFLSSNRLGTMGGMDLYEIREVEKDSTLLSSENTKIETDSSLINSTILENNQIQNSTEKNNFIFHSTALNLNYQQTYGYNQTELKVENEQFLGYLNQIVTHINQKGIVEIIIETSASRVPTTTFGSNLSLAKKRADEAKNKIEKALIGAGFTNEKYKFNLQSNVQGPAYKNDFDINAQNYEPYQYIKLSIR